MRLKTLELQGFKSFPDKTVISFDRGITVVVGPNGSGKSNISDAMRWVLGEVSSKNIRGGKMEDVVFAGSQKRSPMGYAEVSVTFDNTEEEGKIASLAEFDEITITRRYYRVGESEYFINKRSVRLKDIHELFLNTGLGRDGYSIIGQGRIAEIISQKNDERRAIFEEAAGIARYRYQKTEAVKKLEDTEANLVRVEDIVGVLGERVEPLGKESEKAKKFLELRDAKMAVDIALSLFDIDTAKASADELGGQLVLAKADLDGAEENRAELETAEEKTRAEEMNAKMDTERISAKLLTISGAIHECESGIRLAENDAEHLRQTIADAEEKIRTSEQALLHANEEESRFENEMTKASENASRLAEKAGRAENALHQLEQTLADYETQSNTLHEQVRSLREEETEAVVAASVSAAQSEADREKCTELSSNIERYTADIRLFENRIRTAEEKIEGYRKKEESFQNDASAYASEKTELERTLRTLTDQKNNLFLDISQRKHKIQNLVRMEEFLEGYSGAVRFIVGEHKNKKILLPDGNPITLYGPVSKLISVPDRYSAAMEVAFGQSLQNIVVEDEESAKAAINYLKKKNAGRATFYPVSTMHGNELSEKDIPEKSRDGFIAAASALVECDEKFRGIVRSLLGRVLIAEDMNRANKIAKAIGFRYRIVTLDGQVINAGGSFTGGSLSAEGRMLSRRVQIDKLGEEVKTLESSLAIAERSIKETNTKLTETQKKEKTALASAAGIRTMRDAETTQLTVLSSNRDAQAKTLSQIRAEYDALTEKMNLTQYHADTLGQKRAEYAEKIRLAEAEITCISEERTKASENLSAMREDYNTASLEKAKADAALEMLSQMLDGARQRTSDIRGTADSLVVIIRNAEEKIRASEAEAVRLTKEMQTYREELEKTEEQKRINTEKTLSLEQKLTELRHKIRDTVDKRDLLYRTYTKMESEYNSVREHHAKLIAFLWDEYELTYTQATQRATEKITAENRHEAVAAQNRYKNQIRALGSVNVGAIEEYKEVKKQFDDLNAQINDLKKSKESLLSIIATLETTMCHDFMTTMDAININFAKVFSELFGGGRAELKLTDPANVLESGIDINVAPPGKVIKNMSLLSGGEQAFVAIALYFAILKVNPSPFCILDEIEAALDEVNVDKFADYVKKYSDKTQFVIITHRRGTMEAAERLYGVTMHEKGISDVLSIDISEIEQKIGMELH